MSPDVVVLVAVGAALAVVAAIVWRVLRVVLFLVRAGSFLLVRALVVGLVAHWVR